MESLASIKVHDRIFIPYLDAGRISSRIKALALEISGDYRDKQPLFIAILNGAFIFAADLFRELTIPAEISFVKLSSYHGIHSSGKTRVAIGLSERLKDRHVVILEDIVDTGNTMHDFLAQLAEQEPASVQIAALLTKPDALVQPVSVRYTGFAIPNKFVVGYGLDYDGLGRNIPGIYQVQ